MFNLIMCSRSASLFGTVSRHSKRCCNHNDGKSGLTSNGVSDHSSRFLAGEQTNRRYVDAVEIGKDQVPSPRPLLGSNQKLPRPNARRRNQSSPKCRCCDNDTSVTIDFVVSHWAGSIFDSSLTMVEGKGLGPSRSQQHPHSAGSFARLQENGNCGR